MDKETDLLQNAKVIWDMDDDSIKKIRTIASSFDKIYQPAFNEIIKRLNEKGFNFKQSKNHGNTGDIYEFKDSYLQLWHEESYKSGHNKSFWIEVWFYDSNRFEVLVTKDMENAELEELEYYVKSKKYNKYYVDKRVDDGIEAKKFDFPDKEAFEELIDYVSDLYKKLYKLSKPN